MRRSRASSSARGAADNDLIFFGADQRQGRQRRARRAAPEGRPGPEAWSQHGWQPLWVVDFPMFEWDARGAALGRDASSRSPRRRSTIRRRCAPTRAAALARAYDMVLNGSEIGGGSVRIHRAGDAVDGVRAARHRARRRRAEVRLPARCAALRRAAAWRHRLRPRPAGDADGRRRQHPRGDRLSRRRRPRPIR